MGPLYEEFTYFSFVREPLERLKSVYRWQRQKVPDNPRDSSFEAFMDAYWSEDEALRRQAFLHLRTQDSWLRDNHGEYPANLHLFTTERMEEAFGAVSDIVGFKVAAPARGRLNVSEDPGHTALEISTSFRNRIEDAYRADFDLYSRVSEGMGRVH